MGRHDLRQASPRGGRGPLLPLSAAVVLSVAVAVGGGPAVLSGAPMVGGVALSGPVAAPTSSALERVDACPAHD